MTIPVRSRAWRILRRLEPFEPFEEEAGRKVADASGIPLEGAEVVLGLYRNYPSSLRDAVVVTDLGLWVRGLEAWSFVAYREVEKVDVVEPKRSVTKLVLRLSEGRTTILPVLGGTDRTRNAWAVVRFLMRVSEDLQRGNPSSSAPP